MRDLNKGFDIPFRPTLLLILLLILSAPGCEGCGSGGGEGEEPATEAKGIQVGNAEVRACDVVIARAGLGVTFEDAVIGVSLVEGANLGFSFTAKEDAPLSVVGALQIPADAAGEGPVEAKKVECWDRHGKAVAAPKLSFE